MRVCLQARHFTRSPNTFIGAPPELSHTSPLSTKVKAFVKSGAYLSAVVAIFFLACVPRHHTRLACWAGVGDH